MQVGDRVDVEIKGGRWGPATVTQVPCQNPLIRGFRVILEGHDRDMPVEEMELTFLGRPDTKDVQPQNP